MARRTRRPAATRAQTLQTVTTHCPACQHKLWAEYANHRSVTTLDGVLRLTLRIRCCPNPRCPRWGVPYRPEAEGHFALPHHEFGLDVVALVGRLRYAEHRSAPEIHQELRRRGLVVAERTVTNLLDRYDELRALHTADPDRLRQRLAGQKQVILALDGLQPDVGHEVLWVVRDCLSGEILLARSLLSAKQDDLAALLTEVKNALPVSITAVVSDGQTSIRKAVAQALPRVPHQLCHFHYLREAAKPIYEADRHAKKELKKRVRGIRALERKAEGDDDAEAEVVRAYCQAVRSALTDDGRPPLAASGLKLQARLTAIADSLSRVAGQRALPRSLERLRALVRRGLEETAALWPPVRAAYGWVEKVARLLANAAQRPAKVLRQRFGRLLGRMRGAAAREAKAVREPLEHFLKVTASYRPGLFVCYQQPGVPRTNNDLEHLFGSHRYHERRSSGRKQGSPGLVVRGAVRVVTAWATRLQPDQALHLSPAEIDQWRQQRAALEPQREARRQQRRFRRDPAAYLGHWEQQLLQLSLPV
jgi:Transposase, Mutator family